MSFMGGMPTPMRFPSWASFMRASEVAENLNNQSTKFPLKMEPSSWSTTVDGEIEKERPVYVDLFVDSPSRLQHFIDAMHENDHEVADLNKFRGRREAFEKRVEEKEKAQELKAAPPVSLLSLDDPLSTLGMLSGYQIPTQAQLPEGFHVVQVQAKDMMEFADKLMEALNSRGAALKKLDSALDSALSNFNPPPPAERDDDEHPTNP